MSTGRDTIPCLKQMKRATVQVASRRRLAEKIHRTENKRDGTMPKTRTTRTCSSGAPYEVVGCALNEEAGPQAGPRWQEGHPTLHEGAGPQAGRRWQEETAVVYVACSLATMQDVAECPPSICSLRQTNSKGPCGEVFQLRNNIRRLDR